MKEEKKPDKPTTRENPVLDGNKDETPAAPGAGSALSPKEGSGASRDGEDSANEKKQPEEEPKNIAVLAGHKTEYQRYRCAGLVLTSKPENFLVSKTQLEQLQKDPWVVVKL